MAEGFDVEIVSPAVSIRAQLDRWNTPRLSIPQYWRLLEDEKYFHRLNNDYDFVVFPNWSNALEYTKGEKVRLIYDFFSATMVEHAIISNSDELTKKKADKLKIIAQADIVIANGQVQADYATQFLSKEAERTVTGPIPAVRLSTQRLQKEISPPPHPSGRLRLFVGGFHQAWTTGIGVPELVRLAASYPVDIHAIGLGQHLHLRDLSRVQRLPGEGEGLVRHQVSSFENYRFLNGSCDAALDVFTPNAERRISYSTRAISALSCGCPVITMAFTEIGELVRQTGAGWVLEECSIDALRELLVRLAHNPDEISAAREKTADFWARYIDPKVQIAPLVKMLKSGEFNVR
ncbi:MAG: hypothetical protein AAGB11_08415 [Pseudomonadota bacterium]